MTAPLQDRDKAQARMNNDAALYGEILRLFVTTVPAKLAELEAASQQSDVTTIERLSHTIKGGAASVGATQVQLAALALEDGVKDPAGADVPRLLERLLAAFERLRVLVEE